MDDRGNRESPVKSREVDENELQYKQQKVSVPLHENVMELSSILDEAIEKFYMWNMTNMQSLRHVTYLFFGRVDDIYVKVDDIRTIFEAVTGWLKERVLERKQFLDVLEDQDTRNMDELALIKKTLPLLEIISSLVTNMHPIAVQLAGNKLNVRRMLLRQMRQLCV